jgi:hypothetical protein
MNTFIMANISLREHGEYSLKTAAFALLFVLVLGPAMPLAVIAQSNTLQWGVDIGEEFTYVFQRAYFSDESYIAVVEPDLPFISELPVAEKAIINVSSLDSIPTLINSNSQMPLAHCNMMRANDSVSIGTNLTSFVVPIGDWDFLTEIGNITASGLQLIDTAEEWGSIGSTSFPARDGSTISVYFEVRFEKDNGTLNYLRYKYSTLGTDLIDVILVNWHEGMPTVIAADIQISTILIIAIGGLVGIIVAFVVYRRYGAKKPLIQRLGE